MKALFKYLLNDLASAKTYLYWGLLLYFPVTLLAIMQPLIIGDGVRLGMMGEHKHSLLFYGLLFFISALCLAIFELIQGFCLQKCGFLLVKNLRARSFAKAQKLSLGFLDTMPTAKILGRITNDAEAVMEMFSLGAVQIIADALFVLATFIMLFFVNVHLSFYVCLSMPILIIGLYYFRLFMRKTFKLVREVLSTLNSSIQEYLLGLPLIQLANQLKNTHEDFSKLNQKYLVDNRSAVFLDAALYSFVDFISFVATALVLYGAYNIDHTPKALSFGVLIAFIEALSRFFQPLREFSNRFIILESAIVALERIYEMDHWPIEKSKDKAHITFKDKISFINVSFGYKPHETVLADVNLTINKGDNIALIGHSGSGKSTFIKLLNRFYDVSLGHIFIDEHNIKDLSLNQLRHLIAVVPQEVFLFAGSIEDNITLGKKTSDEDIWQALVMVGLDDMIRKRGGLKSLVSKGGHNFSLGERALLSIARTLIANPAILILDEATASIDFLSEQKLIKATKAVLANRTALVIAHRLSTIRYCNRIFLFADSNVREITS